MSEENKAASDLGVTEKMQKLSVARDRDETPPPGRINNRFHSFPIKEAYLGTEESASPPRLGTQLPHFRQKQHNSVRHHELTPVTRNVSYVDECPKANIVSPEDTLPSQPISLPDRPCKGVPLKIKNVPLLLKPVPLVDRSQSLVNLCELGKDSEDSDTEESIDYNVPLQKRNQFFSFNSRQEYQNQTKDSSAIEGSSLTPYQPQRHDLSEIAGLDDDDLSLIFTERDTNPIPINERQLSIPSIRMANRLPGGSIATFDTEFDEEDDLKDDASWSTRGSSLYLPEDSFDPSAQVLGAHFTSSVHEPVVIVEGGDLLLENLPQENDASVNAVQGRKRKSKPEDQAAYDWLRTIERESGIAEAASSKFLTQQRQFARQYSSPGDL
mmetsp:Transcript_32000/g.48675  ORF Transcript_32000/g.48675 Transcript_32000/m.48675 type:complete len:383 (-) Transcript_32000:109-1257(-)|eukprot:CAMPEP_0194217886 /NCGR_PEP_ID=MMETSP0156-20130528/22460_1 /TAXON_ID=33649 /ORGANISM="Thalassionema nitzschioides, Strain L26-B" /LENGTH=382 /DNA_ID=CAMNT_0038947045 /DNA_START=54 /DNA_END=1202 /DNA_ORIENTATION=-